MVIDEQVRRVALMEHADTDDHTQCPKCLAALALPSSERSENVKGATPNE